MLIAAALPPARRQSAAASCATGVWQGLRRHFFWRRRQPAALAREHRQRLPFLLGVIGRDDVLRDRRAEIPVLGVLGEDDASDHGVVPRREEDEPPVVAQILVGAALRRLAALQRNHLRRSGLARDVTPGEPAASAGARRVHDHPQPVVQRRHGGRLQRELPAGAGGGTGFQPLPSSTALISVRGEPRAAVGDRRHHHGQRNRRHRDLPLADGHRDRLAGVPLLARPGLLPRGRRHDALHLVRQIDAGLARRGRGASPTCGCGRRPACCRACRSTRCTTSRSRAACRPCRGPPFS